MITTEILLKTLRTQAWERAKGELQSLLQSYWHEPERFQIMQEAVETFIDNVESNGMQE